MLDHAEPAAALQEPSFRRVYVWQFPIRLFHWVAVGCLMVLFPTGLLIHDPLPSGGEAGFGPLSTATVRELHFAAAYVFTVALLWRFYWFFRGNKYARSGFPFVWRPRYWREVFGQMLDYLRLDFHHRHLGHNALAGLSYTSLVIGLGFVQVFTGFALYSESNPAGWMDKAFGWVLPLLGGSFRTHMWHHLAAWGFVVFAILHVYIVVLDAFEYRNGLVSSMVTGFKFRRTEKDRR